MNNIDSLIESSLRDLHRRRVIITTIFVGLVTLSLLSAWLLFQIEARVLPELIGDRVGILFAALLEIAKPLLTLAAWFVITSAAFKAPSAVKVAGVLILPLLLWGMSGFCVFASVALSTSHPHLEETRVADIGALTAQYATETTLLRGQATAELSDLDGQLKDARTGLGTSLGAATTQMDDQQKILTAALPAEIRAAGNERDFKAAQAVARQGDDAIQHDRGLLRADFETQRDRLQRERDQALAALAKQHELIIFKKDTADKQAALRAEYDQKIGNLTAAFQSKDATLAARLKGGTVAVGTSHAQVANSLETQLAGLSKNYQSLQTDLMAKENATEAQIIGQRRTVQNGLANGLAGAAASYDSRLSALLQKDYSNDPRVQNPLVTATIATVSDGFGISLSRARFVAAFALAASAAIEGVLWVATVWSAVMLTAIFAGIAFDPAAELKKNFSGNGSGQSDFNAESAVFRQQQSQP